MASTKNDYFGFTWIFSLVLAIIPITSWVCGAITRLLEGRILEFVIRIFFGFNILWIVDLIFMIINHRILRFLPI